LEQVRNLLERKMVLAFAGGCAGFIQWLWNTNVYNNSDNEAGIGFLRADGSEKPELAAFRGVSKFIRENAHRMIGRQKERVCLVIPHSNHFSPRDTADRATRRAVRTLEYRLGLPCRAISEDRAAEIDETRLIVLPNARVLSQRCWDALLEKVKNGATLLATGFIEADEHWRETPRLTPFGLHTTPEPVLHEEIAAMPQGPLHAAFASHVAIHPRIEKASPPRGGAFTHGRGKLLYCPLPVELALGEEPAETLYRWAAETAGLVSAKAAGGPGLLARPVEFAEATLWLLVNESSAAESAHVRLGLDKTLAVPVPPDRSAMLFIDRTSGKILSQYPAEA
jgi:hypothetical protein